MLEPRSDHRHSIPDPLSHPPLLWNGWSHARFIPGEDQSLFTLAALHSSSLLPCPSLMICFSWFSYDLDNNKYIKEAHLQMKKLGHRKLKLLAHDQHRSRVSLLPLGHWWPQAGLFDHLKGYWEANASPRPLSSVWWRPEAESDSLACIQFLLVKSFSRSHNFHHERFSVKQREAIWNKLLSIINTIMYNKRHNLTSSYPTKRFIWSFRNSSWKGRAHGGGFSRQGHGECGQGAVLAALSTGTLLHDGIHLSLAPPSPPPENPTVHPIAGTESSLLPRQHWKNNWF